MTALPNYAVAPGEHIEDWLDEHGINAAELARRLDVTPKHVSELLSGKAPLSATISLGLERVTGIPARIWNRFESGYREDLAIEHDTDGDDCLCGPTSEPVFDADGACGWDITHHSLDGREANEPEVV